MKKFRTLQIFTFFPFKPKYAVLDSVSITQKNLRTNLIAK